MDESPMGRAPETVDVSVDSLLSYLDEGLVGLRSQLNELTARLTVVLRPVDNRVAMCDSNGKDVDKVNDSPLYDDIRSKVAVVDTLKMQISDLTNRIQL